MSVQKWKTTRTLFCYLAFVWVFVVCNQAFAQQDQDPPPKAERSSSRFDQKSFWDNVYEQRESAIEGIQGIVNQLVRPNEFDLDEEFDLHQSILALGYLAQDDIELFRYLAARTDTGTWKDTRVGEPKQGEFSNELLAGFSIQGIGASGRQEAREVLDILKYKSDRYLHKFAADIAYAEFLLYTRARHGDEGVWKHLSSPDHEAYVEWTQTEEGKEISTWSREKTRGPVPGTEQEKSKKK